MCKYKKCVLKSMCFIGKVVLFISILALFYKLPSLLSDKCFSYKIKRRKYIQSLGDK